MKKVLSLFLALLTVACIFSLTACGEFANKIADATLDVLDELEGVSSGNIELGDDGSGESKSETPRVVKGKSYDSKDDVAEYLHLYGELPPNYITKAKAEDLGWSGGSVEKYAPGKCIGGSRFGNYEGLLPKKSGRVYYECDIDTLGESSRGAKRIVYSNDGLIYYTDDHYESFTLLYGEK